MQNKNCELIRPGSHTLNWFGNQCFIPAYIAMPRSESDVLRVIRFARDNQLPVRAHGAKHSHAAVIPTSGVLVDFDDFRDVVAIDTEKLQITVRPGIRIQQLSAILRESGMSLMNQGDIDSQAIAGAVMTGTHGAGRHLACISTQIVALRIATSTGEILDLSVDSEPELFRAGRVHRDVRFGRVVDESGCTLLQYSQTLLEYGRRGLFRTTAGTNRTASDVLSSLAAAS
jgi:FAD/FMN-containing dehydrogenase